MNAKITDHLKNIEIHADYMLKIPASEQHIGHIQVALHTALIEIKSCLEEISRERSR